MNQPTTIFADIVARVHTECRQVMYAVHELRSGGKLTEQPEYVLVQSGNSVLFLMWKIFDFRYQWKFPGELGSEEEVTAWLLLREAVYTWATDQLLQ